MAAHTLLNSNKAAPMLAVVLCVWVMLVANSHAAEVVDASAAKAADQALLAGNPALAMVERFSMGSNLEIMAMQVAKATETYGGVATKHGATKAQALVAAEVRKLVGEYQGKWNQNLANAYSSHLSLDELRSLATDGQRSPYAEKLLTVQAAVGTDMKNASSSILTELVSKAMINALK